MKLVVFSICKDEAETIGELLDRIPQKIKGIKEIQKMVISDGSTDDTVAIAKKHGATTIEGVTQKRLAYRFAQAIDLALTAGADVAVNIDGDLQFMPEDIPKLLQPVIGGEADFVAADRFTDAETGDRVRPEHMPVAKYYANRMGARIVGSLSGYRFRDVTCGFRAYNRNAMIALNINTIYTYTQESFQILANKRMDITAMPVKVTYYPGRKSRVVTNFVQFLVNSSLNIIRAFRDFSPLKFFFYLGLVPFIFGVLGTGITAINWFATGQTSPYTTLGIIGVYFISLALIIWVVGLVADMQERNHKNQEKILENLKYLRYEKADQDHKKN